ncbi:hypothetical protein BDN67DRAFT_985510 [Paxillus ammoniavirescens]|nr:hypothetical protein BDN67DRAFT_985510 [Paxillus ammoniavirescens]
MLTEYLCPYFPYGAFYEINLEFDITTKAKMKLYLTFAVEAAASLEQARLKNTIFAITNHSEDNTGDLFLGMFKGTNIANDVGEVLNVLLGPFQALTSGALLLLFTCGFIVTMEKPFCMLQEVVKRYSFGSTITFNATHLHSPVTAHFILSLIECTFVQCYPVHMAMEATLGMLEITDDGQLVLVVKYFAQTAALYSQNGHVLLVTEDLERYTFSAHIASATLTKEHLCSSHTLGQQTQNF